MKLNADIIYNELSKLYDAEIAGPRRTALCLPRPEFYMDNEVEFEADRLVLATADHLPKRPRIRDNSVLVCIGDSLVLNYYRERMCLIIIRNRVDFFKVYHNIQRIYDKFDEWENLILHDLASDRSIRTLITDSATVFDKPVYLLDKSFRIVANSVESGDMNWASTSRGSLNSDAVSKYLSGSDLMTDKKSAIEIDLFGEKALCVNLFNRSDQYEGCLVISLKDKDFVKGEDKLAEFLAEHLQLAIVRNPYMINDSDSSLKTALQNLLEELPLTQPQRILLASANGRSDYRCIYMRYNWQRNHLPMAYLCDIFEDTFPGSCAFVYDNSIVAFVDTGTLSSRNQEDYLPVLNSKISDYISKMGLCAGISGEFSNLFNLRVYYLQAQSATENGMLLGSDEGFFYFESYALIEMIINSLGGLPLETYFPAGFRRLLEHDSESGISYIETLKVFLEENLSYTAAARKLYVHRSTLIDRIARIERELETDLRDPDKRLQYEILLKAIDLEELLRKKDVH